MTTPRIYVASLSDYNVGRIHGVWIDVTDDVDTMREQIQEMLAKSKEAPAEEYAIHEHVGFPPGYKVSDDLEGLAELVELMDKHGEGFEAALSHWGNIEDAKNAMDAYHGAYSSAEDYAEEMVTEYHDLAAVPDIIRNHIDWEGIVRDLECDGYAFVEHGGSIHVFSQW